MPRSRLIFFVIIGAAILVVIVVLGIAPKLTELNTSQSATATAQYAKDNITTIRVVYGTEKERWFRDAIARFTAANPDIKIDPVGQGSMDTYQALSLVTDSSTSLANNQPIPAVWSPAAMIQVNLLNAASKNSVNRDLAINCKPLVVSPLVIMVWGDRAQAFENYYKDKGGITYDNLYDALHSSTINGSWAAIGGQSKWGLIKIGHTDPQTSNSGVMDLLAMANNYYKRTTPVKVNDITNPDFVNWMATIEKAVTTPLISSTGTFVNDVIVKGPASYDFVIAYEALAIENYNNAVGKQGQPLRIVYPPYNLYSDHPLCIIDHPSVTQKQRDAATKFRDFLLSADIQRLALTYGFRPADPTIPTFGAGSDFDKADFKQAGIGPDIGQTFQIPDGAAILQLLQVWKRNFNP